MRSERNSTWQHQAGTQWSWGPLSTPLHASLQWWHTLGHSRDRRQRGSTFPLSPSCMENGLHCLSLAAALPWQHVRHSNPLGQLYSTDGDLQDKSHSNSPGRCCLITEDAPRLPPQVPWPQELFAYCSFFLHCKMLSFSWNLAPGKDWCFWLIWTCAKPCFRMVSSSLNSSKAGWGLLAGLQEKRVWITCSLWKTCS